MEARGNREINRNYFNVYSTTVISVVKGAEISSCYLAGKR
jgi:hypothetical protein